MFFRMQCIACGKTLETGRKKYCNRACTMVAWRRVHPRPDRFCPICKEILPRQSRGGRKYCSKACKMKAFFRSEAGKAFKAKSHARLDPEVRLAWANRHNLTGEQLGVMAESQGHKCAICKQPSKLCVDHDHENGKVRGLLCHRCNSGLGFFRDSPAFLRSAASYLDSAGRSGYGRGMQITIRHGGYGTVEEYRAEIVRGLEGYGMFEMWFTLAELGTATAIRVDFGDSLFQVDTEANVVNKVRECLRRVDSKPGL